MGRGRKDLENCVISESTLACQMQNNFMLAAIQTHADWMRQKFLLISYCHKTLIRLKTLSRLKLLCKHLIF